jgi:hypothetical protein
MSGPKDKMEAAWSRLSQGIVLEAPEGNDVSGHTFLGMEHKFYDRKVGDTLVKCVEWDCSHQIKRAIAKYEEAVFSVVGRYPRMYTAKTPFLDEETKHAACRAPASSEDFVECPTCLDTFPTEFWKKSDSGTKRPIRKNLPMISSPQENHEDASAFIGTTQNVGSTRGARHEKILAHADEHAEMESEGREVDDHVSPYCAYEPSDTESEGENLSTTRSKTS